LFYYGRVGLGLFFVFGMGGAKLILFVGIKTETKQTNKLRGQLRDYAPP